MAVEDIKKKKLTDDELDEVAGGGGESGPGASAERDLDDNKSKINDPLKIVRRPLERTLFQNRMLV